MLEWKVHNVTSFISFFAILTPPICMLVLVFLLFSEPRQLKRLGFIRGSATDALLYFFSCSGLEKMALLTCEIRRLFVTYFALIHCNCDQHVAFPTCLILFLKSFLK